MKKRMCGLAASLACLALAGVAFAGGPPTFTGNVPADFTSSEVVTFPDPGGVGDVGVPAPGLCPPVPGGSGWDIAAVYFQYDRLTDVMYVGFDYAFIAGDADNDGNPGGSSPGLLCQGGFDSADVSATESIDLALDTDLDGDRDVVVGVRLGGSTATFEIANYNEPVIPPLAYGAPLPNAVALFASPSAGAPDWEFTIDAFSTLPGLGSPDPINGTFRFAASVFSGSFNDDGFGEDNVNPHLITLLCEGFDDQDTGTEINLQYAAEGVIVSGASDSGFPGVFTGRPTDDPAVDDNVPVNPPNILKTRAFAGDPTSDAGQIFFHFVNPLDGNEIGATTASLWFIDVEGSGGGAATGSFFNVTDAGANTVCTSPVPVGPNAGQQFLECNDPNGTISTVHADIGFPNGFDSACVDFICANLNPFSIPIGQITSSGFSAVPGERSSLTVRRSIPRRDFYGVKLELISEGGGESYTVLDRTTRLVRLGRRFDVDSTKSVAIPMEVPTGDYNLHLELYLSNGVKVSDHFVPVTVQ